MNRVAGEFVDNPVAVKKALTHIRVVQLGDHASKLRMCSQVVADAKKTLDNLLGVVGGGSLLINSAMPPMSSSASRDQIMV